MRLFLIVIFAIQLMGACRKQENPSLTETARSSALPLTISGAAPNEFQLNADATVASFYKMNSMKMVWMDSFNVKANADSVIHFISQVGSLGLIPDDYHFSTIQKMLKEEFVHETAVQLDVLLTDSYFTLWHHLKHGRVDPKTFGRKDIDSLMLSDAMEALRSALASHAVNSVLREREPKSPTYSALKRALKNSLKQNTADTVILEKRYQLIANLERLRWEKKTPDRYITVNVPSYVLQVIEHDSLILESRVIVGKPETPTPNIRSVINSFIIYPYWHVPRSILKEILPSIQQDTSYLKKNNYQVIDHNGKIVKNAAIDFKKYTSENFPYVLRQREGSENTMGVIKFVFPNNYGVYLHDTNARRLFSKSDRALSHGCIRVQKAVELAKYLAKDDDTYVDAADLEQYLMVQKRMNVKVKRPIPVHLDYYTVRQHADSVVFYRDLYDRDKALVDSLNRVEMQPLL